MSKLDNKGNEIQTKSTIDNEVKETQIASPCSRMIKSTTK